MVMLSSLHGCPQRPLFFFWALHIVHAPLQVRQADVSTSPLLSVPSLSQQTTFQYIHMIRTPEEEHVAVVSVA
jgi:hypothetical protein